VLAEVRSSLGLSVEPAPRMVDMLVIEMNPVASP
jgi:hypothetical protein